LIEIAFTNSKRTLVKNINFLIIIIFMFCGCKIITLL
jgi:hypothetical protein